MLYMIITVIVTIAYENHQKTPENSSCFGVSKGKTGGDAGDEEMAYRESVAYRVYNCSLWFCSFGMGAIA